MRFYRFAMATKKLIFLALFIYLVGLIPRLYQLKETTVYPDEITWMVFGKESVYAILHLNSGYFKHAWWNNEKDTYAIGLPLVISNGISHVLFAGDGKLSLKLFSDIVASRIPVVLIGNTLAPLMFIFLRKWIGNKAAFLASLTYSLSPISIGMDRWVLHDSFLALFSFLGIVTFVSALEKGKLSGWPGVWLSLGFLTKPNGLLVLVFWLALVLQNRKNKILRKLLLINIGSFLLLTTIVWPASWSKPVFAIPEYLYRQTKLSTNAGDPIPNFYLGKPTRNPSWSYYLFQFFFRLPEIIIVFSIFSGFMLLKSNFNESKKLSLTLYIIVFLVFVTLPAVKGGVRYLLPLLPWVYALSAWGFCQIINYFDIKIKSLVLSGYLILSIYPLYYHPNYYLYYNSLIGGPRNAVKYDLVGLCFGSKKALEYLDSNNISGSVAVIGCSDTAPYHTGRPLTKNWQKADIVILESSFKQQFPQSPSVYSTNDRILIKSIYENGVMTATIYR